jgi:ATP-dependent RNA helicase DeaD
MICRRGHVTKTEIGAIRIFERETRFQIIGPMAEQFATVAAKGGGDGGNIERLDDDAPPPPRDRNVSASRHRAMSDGYEQPRERKPRKEGPREDQAGEAKPRGEWAKPEKAGFDAARPDKPRFDKPRKPKPEGFNKADGFKSDGFKKADKPPRPKPASSPFAGPDRAERPWSPPLDGDGPPKPPHEKKLKVKKSKKRKANG